MNPSLSVILPVHNAGRSLARVVGKLLDTLPDLGARFEILVIDDGSTDHTLDVLDELRRRYPQLRAARHPWQRGRAASVQTGMARASGDILFVQENQEDFSPADMRRLWELRGDERLLLARTEPQPKPLADGLLARLSQWGLSLTQSDVGGAGLQMIRRQAVEELRDLDIPAELVEVSELPRMKIARTDGGHCDVRPARQAGFLAHLRRLAVGE